ncbi:hypothetical protein GGI35DRAFT_25620 [Trichoderma velutinum]
MYTIFLHFLVLAGGLIARPAREFPDPRCYAPAGCISSSLPSSNDQHRHCMDMAGPILSLSWDQNNSHPKFKVLFLRMAPCLKQSILFIGVRRQSHFPPSSVHRNSQFHFPTAYILMMGYFPWLAAQCNDKVGLQPPSGNSMPVLSSYKMHPTLVSWPYKY